MYVTHRFALPGVRELQREMDQLFSNLLGENAALNGVSAYPAINLWEDAERIYAEAEVPGLKMEDLELLIQGGELTIKGRRGNAVADGATCHRRERSTGEFMRFMSLPTEVDGERVEATLKDGVLRIVMPKAERAKARKITVKTH